MGLFKRKKADEAKKKKEKVASVDKKTAVKKEASIKDEVKKVSKTKVSKTSTAKKGSAYKILVKPLVTEKAANMGTKSKYVFEVSTDANKIEVAKAIEEVYGEKPVAVNIMNYSGKKVTSGRLAGRRKDWRKAIVTLAKGKSINIYEGI